MAIATIVQPAPGHSNPWLSADGLTVFCALSVNDGGSRGTVEYVVSTNRNLDLASSGDNAGPPKAMPQLRADLTAALKALRDGQLGGPGGPGALSGTVTV